LNEYLPLLLIQNVEPIITTL